MTPILRAATAALALAIPAVATADEAWTTDAGEAFWDVDVGATSVFSVPTADGTVRLYIPGLMGRVEKRGVHMVTWIGTGDGPCDSTLTGADGVSGTEWGTAILSFDHPAFPTGWTATLGLCGAAPSIVLRGEPIVGPG